MAMTFDEGPIRITIADKGEPPSAQNGRLSDAEVALMTPAQRLDYCARFDQSRMPEWRNPRAR